MRFFIFTAVWLMIPMTSFCQSKILADWHLGVSYYGNNLINPGLQVTGEKLLWEKQKSRVRRNQSVELSYKQYLFDTNLGFFYDNPTYFALLNSYVIQQREVQEKGKYTSYGVGLGYIRTFLPETFSVASNGSVTQAKRPGNWYFAPEVTIGLGRLWKRKSSQPWRLQVHALFLTNYNLGPNILFNVEYGYVFGYKSKETEVYEN